MQDERLYDEKELEKSWLISYGDLFTLLFVIILVIAASYTSHVQVKLDELKRAGQERQQEIRETEKSREILELQKLELQREIALLEAKRDALLEHSPTIPAEREQEEKNMETLQTRLAAALHDRNIPFAVTEEGVLIRLPETVLFASGSAQLKPEGKQQLAELTAVLSQFPHRVRIEGHTDNTPPLKGPYASNWELSLNRAVAVLQEFVQTGGLPASRFDIVGWGEERPIAPNTTAENRSLNRRVELVILADQEFSANR